MAFLYWIRLPEHTDMFTEGYIGITVRTVEQRWAAHKAAAKTKSKQHLPIYRALNKYGSKNLVVQPLAEASEEYVTDLEMKLRPREGIGWNCARGGQDTGSGRTQSAEERAKRAESARGRKHSDESKAKMSAASKGKPKSESHKEKCKIAALGKKRPPHAIESQRQKMLGRKIHTDESKAKMSEMKKALKKWEHSQANKALWAQADVAFVFMQESQRFSQRYLAKHFGLKDSQVYSLYGLLESGWNPSEDPAWLAFKETYLKQKEAANAETSTQPSTALCDTL